MHVLDQLIDLGSLWKNVLDQAFGQYVSADVEAMVYIIRMVHYTRPC